MSWVTLNAIVSELRNRVERWSVKDKEKHILIEKHLIFEVVIISILREENEKRLILKTDRCKGCYLCVEVCPLKSLEASDELNVKGIYPPSLKVGSNCVFCGMCEYTCPDFAIYVVKVEK
jgi:2-oxoglutarate ferredoxin oxidoreductase subunit delta